MRGIIYFVMITVFAVGAARLYAVDKPLPKGIASSIVSEETGDVLTLRGVGLDRRFFQDNYMGGYYSLNPVNDPTEALQDDGPKRMIFYFLRASNDFHLWFEEAIELNNSPIDLTREQINIGQFLDFINSPLQRGDTLVLDYVPNVGTKVSIKGSFRGVIKGNEFYNLVLKVWMGRQPPSKKFRKDLFNLSKGIHL